MTRPVAVAITGGIGAGKSEALKAFARHGAATVSSDEIVHHLLAREGVRDAIVGRVGNGVVGPDGMIDRLREDSGLPIEHLVVDLDADRAHVTRTLVVANQTVGGGPLIDLLKRKGAEARHNFVVILPQGEGGEHGDAEARLAHTLDLLHGAGLEAVGQVMDPDPFTAVQNALQFYPADEIVVSTFPDERSGWLRSHLIERIKASTSKPVEHVVVTAEEAREGATV